MARTTIKFEKVYKSFGINWVLRNINLNIKKGERIVICGPSGAGKSTLIRCINGLESYDRGNVQVGGVHVCADNLPLVRAQTGMLFQAFNLFPHMTVLENCVLAQKLVHKKTHEQALETALHFLEKVKIVKYVDKYPIALSGGQQQRAAIARCLCIKPQVLLFDEPTSALDPEMIREVLDVMLDLGHSGITMICVTHEMGFAKNFADRICFMAEGKIIEKADPKTFFTNPKHPRTQAFLQKIWTH